MSRVKPLKIGGAVVAVFFTVVSTVLPNTGWLNPQVSKWAFLIAIGGIIIGGVMWLYGWKTQKLGDKQLIKSIPQIISDMHIRRGQVTNKYVQKAIEAGNLGHIQAMNAELNIYLGGIEIPKTIDSVEGLFDVATKVFENLPKMRDKAKTVSDIELGRLVAKSAETNLPIQAKLGEQKDYRKLQWLLKTAREKLTKGIAVEATKAIDYYLTYSEAYWAINVLLLSSAEILKDTESMMQTVYLLYKDKFQEQMNINLAKVCEVINEYDK